MLLLIGIFSLSFSIKFLRNSDYAKKYIKNSSKTFLWRKMFGEEKAYNITRKIFVPFGIFLGIIFIIFGLFLLYLNFNPPFNENIMGENITPNNNGVIFLNANNSDVTKAKERALNKIDYFINSLNNSDYIYDIKTSFEDDEYIEHMWINVNLYSDGKFYGILVNEPEFVSNYKNGDSVIVLKENVEDWVILDKDFNIIDGDFLEKILKEK